MFFVKTGNHHLFLILRSQAGEEWIALLGKRKPNFPFLGERFENATFYNVTKGQLHHCAEEEMEDLSFECGENWKITGQRPFDFSLTLQPGFLAERKKLFGKIALRYHLLSLISGKIAGQTIPQGRGFSEQGTLSLLPFQKFQVPFHYLLILNADSTGGFVKWKTFFPLQDRFGWGRPPHEVFSSLCPIDIPLKNWTLHREIVRGVDAQNQICYGLREYFTKVDQKI